MSRVDVFERIFIVFLGLGTLIGIIVVAYTLKNAYKYRDNAEYERADDEDRPTLGELPTGGGGGKKLFVSFGLSAIVVISLIIWTYSMLLYVEAGPGDQPGEDALEVQVEGWAFGWDFVYENENGEEVRTNEMVVPEDTTVWVTVTSQDVWHAFGVPDQKVKADAIPGEYEETWFHTGELEEGEDERVQQVECFELCGDGHSNMVADLRIVPQEEYEQWLSEQEPEDGGGENNESGAGNESDGGNESDADNESDSGNETAADNESDAGNESDVNNESSNGNETTADNESSDGNESDNETEGMRVEPPTKPIEAPRAGVTSDV